MKKFISCLSALVLCFSLVIVGCLDVKAEGIEDLGKIVDGSKLINEKYSEKIAMPLTIGNILNQGLARITNNENGTVNIYGAAFGSVTCDKITIKLTLQQYRNGSWYNYGTYSDVAYNTSTYSRSWNVGVSSGYYYRIKAVCSAQKGGTTESQAPVTDGLWIS